MNQIKILKDTIGLKTLIVNGVMLEKACYKKDDYELLLDAVAYIGYYVDTKRLKTFNELFNTLGLFDVEITIESYVYSGMGVKVSKNVVSNLN